MIYRKMSLSFIDCKKKTNINIHTYIHLYIYIYIEEYNICFIHLHPGFGLSGESEGLRLVGDGDR